MPGTGSAPFLYHPIFIIAAHFTSLRSGRRKWKKGGFDRQLIEAIEKIQIIV